MDVPILEVPSGLHREDSNLLSAPVQTSRERPHQDPVPVGREIFVVPDADLLVFAVLRPSAGGPLEPLNTNVLETDFDQDVFEPIRRLERRSKDFQSLMPETDALHEAAIFRERAVVADWCDVALVKLEVASVVQVANSQAASVFTRRKTHEVE